MDEKVQKYLIKFFLELGKQIPTKDKKKHALVLNEDTGILTLWVWIYDVPQSILFDEDYDDSTPEQIVSDIKKMLIKAGYEM